MSLAVEEAFERFQMLLKAQRNVKDSSLNTYMQTLFRFKKWAEQRGVKFEDWNAELVTRYVAGFKDPMTRHIFALTLKNFWNTLELHDAEKIKIPRQPKRKLPDVLLEKDILRLARACDNVRDRVLVLLTYESSRRNHEIVGLKIKDVRFDEWGALVRFRSTKSEDALIRCTLAASDLAKLVALHPDEDNPDAFLFLGTKMGKPLSASSFRWILRKVSKKAGVYIYHKGKKKAVWPHLLRHSRIAEFKRNKKKYNMSEHDIMNVTGHTDPRMLIIYGKITNADTNEKLLIAANLKEAEEKEQTKIVKCRRCGQLGTPLDKYCGRCTFPLDETELLSVIKEKEAMDRDLKVIREHLPLLLSLVEDARKREQQ